MPRAMRNAEYWDEIYNLPVFQDKDQPSYDHAWKWAEAIQNDGQIRQVDLFRLMELLRACCEYNPTKSQA